MKAAFGGYLGKEMKSKAKTWAKETPNIKSLPAKVKPSKSAMKKKMGTAAEKMMFGRKYSA